VELENRLLLELEFGPLFGLLLTSLVQSHL
jgi:hypothetical protein